MSSLLVQASLLEHVFIGISAENGACILYLSIPCYSITALYFIIKTQPEICCTSQNRGLSHRKIGTANSTREVRVRARLAGYGRVTRNHQHRPCLKNFANQLQEFVWKFEVFGQVHVELPRLWPWQSQPFNVAMSCNLNCPCSSAEGKGLVPIGIRRS